MAASKDGAGGTSGSSGSSDPKGSAHRPTRGPATGRRQAGKGAPAEGSAGGRLAAAAAKKPAAKGRKAERPEASEGPDERAANSEAQAASDLADQLEQLDRALLETISRRAQLLSQQPSAKPRSAGWLGKHNSGPLATEALEAIFRELDAATLQLAARTKVAYLGPPHSYSHIAALAHFGGRADLVSVSTIAAVFDEVARGQADHGVVPIENSTDGRIVDTLEMFVRQPLTICGEVRLRIHHYLLGLGGRDQVREVYSKPQAISQCREWLAKHLPEAKIVACGSTAAAAQKAAETATAAAIASRQAGQHYGLRELASRIEDNPNNVTRFVVLGRELPERTGNDRTSLLFGLRHQPGALADAMAVFKRHRLNLTWIESFPKRGSPQEYLFFVELEGHPRDVRVRRALASLEKKTDQVTILGAYPRTEVVD